MKTVLYGLQYGDEGKGKVVSYFAPHYHWCVRFNGGPNAGHTVYSNDKKYALHQLPSGILFGNKVALDAGMVIDTEALFKEIETLDLNLTQKIFISSRAHCILSEHKTKDIQGSEIGSTKKGIAYAYSDKSLRKGIRIEDLPYSQKSHFETYDGLVPFGRSEDILFESAQGIMLDIDYGHYPFVTSSSVMPSGYYKIDKRIGVMKAYTSRVGDGPPFRKEIPWVARIGNEVGTTTGRPRKCYWNDYEELQYAIKISQPDEIVVTKLDILEQFLAENPSNNIEFDFYNHTYKFNRIEDYIECLLERFPQITYLSKSPEAKMSKVFY